jgi:hypothetical protein
MNGLLQSSKGLAAVLQGWRLFSDFQKTFVD